VGDACRAWIRACSRAGARLVVPGIVNYETRRELLRARKQAAVDRLDRFIAAAPGRYLPLTDAVLLRAAELWAESRQRGLPTADPRDLDVDVILVAQALSLGVPSDDLVVATTNVGHLSRFLEARQWTEIQPTGEG
jgi:predicted nucleic acid-binding protein